MLDLLDSLERQALTGIDRRTLLAALRTLVPESRTTESDSVDD